MVVGLSFKSRRARRRGKEKEKGREAILESRKIGVLSRREEEKRKVERWEERHGRKREEDSSLSQVLSCQHG